MIKILYHKYFFEKDEFEKYIKTKSKLDYENYGKEKTLILFKNKSD